MTQRAARYRRISDDREGREVGVERQGYLLDRLAEKHDLTYVEDFSDNDRSASTLSTKPRPRYDAMIADAKAGKFEVIAAYSTSRLTRRPMEFESLIDLSQKFGIEFIYCKSPKYDLNTASGREAARNAAARDAQYAESISELVTEDVARRARDGDFHGGPIPFGYEALREIVDGRLRVVEIRPHPVHAKWVREAVRRILAGEKTYGIVRDWNADGRTTPAGNRWQLRTLKRALTGLAIIGKRDYDGTTYPAPWPAIVDEADAERVRALLADPARRVNQVGTARKYELSGLVWCSLCQHAMTSTSNLSDRHASYECSKAKGRGGCGRMKVRMDWLERYIEEQFFATVDHRAMAQALAHRPADDGPERALSKAIAADESRLERVEAEYDADEITKDEYQRRRENIRARMKSNEDERARIIAAAVQSAPLPSGDALRREWPHRDSAWRRAMLEKLIERVWIKPHPAGVTTSPAHRANETAEEFSARVDRHAAYVLARRVQVDWRV